MPVIAIARQAGAGAAEVAAAVAAALGIPVVDRRIIDEIARRIEVSAHEAERLDEAPAGLLERLLTQVALSVGEVAPSPEYVWTPPYPGDPSLNLQATTIAITQEVVRQSFSTGNAVIVGRGSTYILAREPSVLRVMLRADRELRIAAVAAHDGVDIKAAKTRLHELDSNWAAYARQVHHVDRDDPSLYDLVVDTGRLGHRGAAEAIVGAVRAWPHA